MRPTPFLILIGYFTIYVVWATNYITIKIALESIPPFALGGIRFIASGIIIYTLSLIAGNHLLGFRKSITAIKQGFLLNVGGTGSLIWAEQYVASGIASIVFASIPLWIVLIDSRQWKQNLKSPSILFGITLGIAGVGTLFGLNQIKVGVQFLTGLFVLLMGAISWSAGTIFVKYSNDDIPILTRLAIQMTTAGFAMGLIALINGERNLFEIGSVTSNAWMSLAFQILFGSIMGYVAFLWLLKIRPALEVSTYNFVQPCVAILLGILIGGEEFNLRILLALGLILFAVFLIRYVDKIRWKNHLTKVKNIS